jgi:hypothetical protein
MEGVWFGIMHSLNLILPRPDEDEKKIPTPPTVKPPKEIKPPSPTRRRAPGTVAGSEAESGLGTGSPNQQQQQTKEKPRNFLKKLFQSDDSDDDHVAREDEDDEEEEEVEDVADPDLNISIKERNLHYPLLLLKDYGKPLYQHLSRGSWELLLASRCQMEEMVKILELEVSIVSHLPILSQETLAEGDGKEVGFKQQQGKKKSPQSMTRWTLDSSIPMNGQQKQTTNTPAPKRSPQERQSINSRGDELSDLPTIHQSTSPRLKPSPPVLLPPSRRVEHQRQRQEEIKTIQQRLDSHVNLPYHASDENRFRRKKT